MFKVSTNEEIINQTIKDLELLKQKGEFMNKKLTQEELINLEKTINNLKNML